jgi:hypothetical protein
MIEIYRIKKVFWISIVSRRNRVEFADLKSFKLHATKTGNRLTIDNGTKREEIAQGATEVKREWLFNYINKNYF